MKLLLFSDVHRDAGATRDLVARAEAHDALLVGAGDFATVRRGLSDVIDVLRASGRPAVLVPGNNETDEELRAACAGWEGAVVLHGESAEVSGIAFRGLGCGVPVTPFGAWSFDLDEARASRLLEGTPTGGVLISHSPPKDCLDVSSAGRSLGSTAVREAIERDRPALVVCGHIHHSSGSCQRLGDSWVVNAGKDGVWFDWDAGQPIGEP